MGRRKQSAFDRAERQDDYVNTLTGIGDYSRDRMMGGRQYGALDFFVREFTQTDCEARWRGNDLGCRLVEAIPDEMTREGWELSVQPSEDGEGAEDEEQTKPGKKPKLGEKPDPREDAFGPPDPMAALMGEGPKNPKPIEPADDEPQRICEDVEAKMEELGAVEAVTRALQYERAYGGAVILLGADDGKGDLTRPLDEERIKDITWLNVFSGGRDGECIAWTYYNDPRSAKFGKPEVYQIRNMVPLSNGPVPGKGSRPQSLKEATFYVHESRLLVFPGTAVSNQQRVKAGGWGDSIFVRIDEVLSQYSQTWGGVANLMAQLHIDVLKMSGLAVGLAADKSSRGSKTLANRANTINQTKGIARMLVIDAEEEFQRETASLAGVNDTLREFAVRLAAAADMPVTLLMGTSPGGMNATGESDIRFFYDRIGARQKRFLLPILRRLYRLVMLAKEGPTEGIEPDMWNIKFNPLRQLSELEQAELRKVVAETDQIYITQGVLSAEEVAASAYGGSEWSMERTIDFEGREQMAEEDAAQMEEKKAKAEEVAGQQMEMANKELEIKAKASTKKPPAK
jgi:phage-related protein (TIGR01555 family)